MKQFISQALQWFLKLFVERTILILTILFCVGGGLALANMFHLANNLIESQALQNAALSTESVEEAVNLYNDEAVNRAQTVPGIDVRPDYPTHPGGIPIPATYAIELGQHISQNISQKNPGTLYRLYSNLTYRIESCTLGGQILISEATLKAAGSIVKIHGQKEVQLKGVKQAITIYEVEGIGGEYNLFLTKEEEVFIPLHQPIPVQYVVLDGKHIGETLCKGSLVKLSAKGSEVLCDHVGGDTVPSPLSNIKLNLLPRNHQAEANVDIYAKVLEKPSATGSFYIDFTAIPPNVEAKLNALYKSIRTNAPTKSDSTYVGNSADQPQTPVQNQILCSNCGHKNRANFNFCSQCGQQLV